jgi:hypothetical protein
MGERIAQAQPPPALDELVLGDGLGDGEPPEDPPLDVPGVKLVTAAVTLAPVGATSHHFAPKAGLPCPLACPAAESPEK